MPALLRRSLAALALIACFAAVGTPALADEYDRSRAGHPLRILAYVLHPFGAAIDWLVLRPAHWAGSQPAFQEIFGHDVDEEPQR
jgi:hypothetical protein